MKFSRSSRIILVCACVRIVSAQSYPDTLWLFKDTIPDSVLYYLQVSTCDTSMQINGCFNQVDTGDKYNGNYINFNYQFGNPHPGYAGFKMFWDNGYDIYDATKYDSLYLVHKGPLPGHKVHMVWGIDSAVIGKIIFRDFGDFKSSTEWKAEAIPFPPGYIKRGLFELRFLIYNDTATSPTSAPGCLKLDNIAFIKRFNHKPVITSTPSITASVGRLYSYTVTAIDPDLDDSVGLFLETSPAGMTLLNSVISWTPTLRQVGNNVVSISAHDNLGAIANQSFTITVTTLQINSSIPHIFYTDSLYKIPLTAAGGENTSVSWTVTDKPLNMQIVSDTLIWSPNASNVGMDTLVVIASDSFSSDTLRQALIVVDASRSILVSSPNGGEIWTAGKSREITWASTGTISRVRIELSLDSCRTWRMLAAGVDNNGFFRFTAPDTASEKCFVQVADSADTLIRDASNAAFSIVPSTAARSARRPLPTSSGLVGIAAGERQGTVTIQYALARPCEVSMNIYSVKGMLMRSIAARPGVAGYYTMAWDGRDEHGRTAAVGAYIVRVQIGGMRYGKMVVLSR